MEDSQEKLDLMMDCYLGKWHPIYGDEIQVNSFGIGNAFFGIAGYGQNLTQGINPEKCVEKLIEEPSQERFKDLVKLRDEWYEADNPSYTERIVALCSRMKSEPTILQK